MDRSSAGSHDRENKIFDNESWGLYLEKTKDCKAYCNTIVRCAQKAQYCAGLGVKASENDLSSRNGIYHNVVFDSGWWGLYCGAYQDLGPSRFDSNVIQNNIIVGARNQLFYSETGGANDGINGTGNIYTYNCFGPERKDLAVWIKTYNNYRDWEVAYGSSMQFRMGDPLFRNSAAGDFTLQETSNCRAAAIRAPDVPYARQAAPDVGLTPLSPL